MPLITPAKVPAALVRVSVLFPSATVPALPPVRFVIEVPPDSPEISNLAFATTPLEAAMLAVPVKASTPALIVVEPW